MARGPESAFAPRGARSTHRSLLREGDSAASPAGARERGGRPAPSGIRDSGPRGRKPPPAVERDTREPGVTFRSLLRRGPRRCGRPRRVLRPARDREARGLAPGRGSARGRARGRSSPGEVRPREARRPEPRPGRRAVAACPDRRPRSIHHSGEPPPRLAGSLLMRRPPGGAPRFRPPALRRCNPSTARLRSSPPRRGRCLPPSAA